MMFEKITMKLTITSAPFLKDMISLVPANGILVFSEVIIFNSYSGKDIGLWSSTPEALVSLKIPQFYNWQQTLMESIHLD